MTTVAELPAGFSDKVLSAQATFRSVMNAMARPSSVHRVAALAGAPGAMMRGTAAIALTLFDHDTPVWLESNEYPDRSTTLILQVESLTQGPPLELRGPGINGAAMLQATIQPADLFERLEINRTLFPRGIDVMLVADDAIAAMPRTTRLVAKGG